MLEQCRIRSGAVAMHWDWVCDVLGPEQQARLDYRSADQLARTNAALSSHRARP